MPLSRKGHRCLAIRDSLNDSSDIGGGLHRGEEILPQIERRPWLADQTLAAWGAAGLCAFFASVAAAPDLSGLLGAGLAAVMIAIAAIDARQFVIPDKLVLAGLALGLLEISFAQVGPIIANIGSSALRALLLAALFLGFRLLYRTIRGYDGLGLGDVKLAAVAGLWLDWMSAAIAVDIAALSALAFVLIAAARHRRVTGKTKVPFGLFFAPAIWLSWLIGTIISRVG
jgi:leader peptidase (prepilin peptidase)/N-methyltransferase